MPVLLVMQKQLKIISQQTKKLTKDQTFIINIKPLRTRKKYGIK